MTNRFKNGAGAHLTKAIFYETDTIEKNAAIYTLKDSDHTVNGVTYPSLRRLYVECEDPTEYSFAVQYLDNWNHWKKITTASFFQEYLKEWREELEVRLRSKRIAQIKTVADTPGKEAYQAQKFLATAGWKTPEDKEKVGRPTKQRIKEEAEKLFESHSDVDADFTRIFGKESVN